MKKILAICTILVLGLMIIAGACGTNESPASTQTSAVTNPAVKLVFTTQPSGGVAGTPFDTQPVVAAQDSEGNVVTGYRTPLALTITTGSGINEARLLGGTTLDFKNGKVDFKSLTIDKAGAGYTLTASSGNLISAVSAPFTILPGKPAKLAFSVQPAEGKVGTALNPAPEVIVQDVYGNTVTGFDGQVTLSGIVTYPNFNNDQYGSQPKTVVVQVVFGGTTTVRAVNGVARFTDITAKLAGEKYNLKAVSESLDSATSSYFEMLFGDPAKLEFSIHPEGAVAGVPFEIQPKVVIMDAYGNVVTGARTSNITVSITPGSGTAGAVLSGKNPILTDGAFGGLAEFEDLSIDLAGSGYTLTAVLDNGVLSLNSQAFDVTAPTE